MKKIHIILLSCILALLQVCGTISAQSIFSDSLYNNYKTAYNLNDAGQYLEAYRAINQVRNQMNAEMGGLTAEKLSEDDFQLIWWPINRSVAEIAYMLGLTNVMQQVADEMDSALSSFLFPKNTFMAQLLKVDAGRHFLTGDLPTAEIELYEALDLSSPYEESFISDLHDELAQLYYARGEYLQALLQLDSVLPNPALAGQRALCLAQLGRYQESISILNAQSSQSPRKQAELLRQKAKVYMLQYDETGIYTPLSKQYYIEYLRRSRSYIEKHFVGMTESERELYWMAEQPFVTDCYRLEDKAPELLYDVALFSKAVLLQMGRKFKPGMTVDEKKKVLSSINVNWQQVQQRLPDTAVAIEFIVYERGHADHLGALVLKKKGSPIFVPIASLADILNHVLPNGSTLDETMPRTGDYDAINAIYYDTTLHRLIWTDLLMEVLGQCRTIYFAPDGILHRIAVEYMLPGYKMSRLSSTRMLAETPRKLRNDSMLMVGGVNYRKTLAEREPDIEEMENDDMAYQLLAPLKIKLSKLEGTKVEIEEVNKLRQDKNNKMLEADSATEFALRKLMEKYHIVLLSTHGWVDEDALYDDGLRPAKTDAQLSHSCLFLSGAEYNMSDSSFNTGSPDGILSARELAAMDLSGVDLAVLSACVSGLGIVTANGIYGLQRGLKSAGVQAVIVSLWEVSDKATSLLIKNLFANIEQGLSLQDAFNLARQQLKSEFFRRRFHGRNVKCSFDRPYYTDAFILIDGIE